MDVKRCHALRGALELFDYDDADSASGLVQLLLRCSFAPCFLRCAEGRRFVSSLFTLHGPLTRQLFDVVKEQLPTARASMLDTYGDILFRAWRTAAGAPAGEMERTILSGLAAGSLTASNAAAATACRKVLHAGFLVNRSVAGVDAALLRAYRPLLFRALSAANPAVRRNAASALFDLFPLHDPEAAVNDTDALLARQAQAFADLLADDAPAVRSVAVMGVVNVLDSYYELIPPKTAAGYLHKLVIDLANDAAAPAVRTSVATSLAGLVVNPAAQALLQPLLPKLAHLGNDSSPHVRAAFADLLLAVRGVRAIKFYEVMPLDAIHEWLASETDAKTASTLARVLVPTYVPGGATLAEAARRLLALAEKQPAAAAAFARRSVTGSQPGGVPATVAHDLVALLATALAAASGGEEAVQQATAPGGRKKRRAKDEPEAAAVAAAPVPPPGVLPPAVWESVAETMAALCDGIASQKRTPGAAITAPSKRKTKVAAMAAAARDAGEDEEEEEELDENEDGNGDAQDGPSEKTPVELALLAALRCAPTPGGQAAVLRAGTCLAMAAAPRGGSSASAPARGRKAKAPVTRGPAVSPQVASARASLAAHCRTGLRELVTKHCDNAGSMSPEEADQAVRMMAGLCAWGGAPELCDILISSLSSGGASSSATAQRQFDTAAATCLCELAMGDNGCRSALLSCRVADDLLDALHAHATAAVDSRARHADVAVRAAGKAAMHAALMQESGQTSGRSATGGRQCAMSVAALLASAVSVMSRTGMDGSEPVAVIDATLALAAECTRLGLLAPATPPAMDAATSATAVMKALKEDSGAAKHAALVAGLAEIAVA